MFMALIAAAPTAMCACTRVSPSRLVKRPTKSYEAGQTVDYAQEKHVHSTHCCCSHCFKPRVSSLTLADLPTTQWSGVCSTEYMPCSCCDGCSKPRLSFLQLADPPTTNMVVMSSTYCCCSCCNGSLKVRLSSLRLAALPNDALVRHV